MERERIADLTGDRAKLKIEDDEFGLADFVRALVAALKDRIAADGYSIAGANSEMNQK